ncbi:SUN domain-containing ossification factor-like isoform X2 [Mercenaria mercenaria]|uniref:SUN domain-containing ossification factor-like isoform X2 n=1 Tax=Mercenaria mercenaria TaxID=6596 RepID=UPI00234E47AE|nr:SUN domain-containing ossification factor-like isoform X2 [Mercenaria mercenaria]
MCSLLFRRHNISEIPSSKCHNRHSNVGCKWNMRLLHIVLCCVFLIVDFQVTNVDIPADIPVQPQVKHTHSSEQVTETVSPVEDTEPSIQASSSLSTSLTVDQSEASSIKEGTSSSTQIEPSFSEIQGTSQTEQYLSESVTQSTSIIHSDVVLDKPADDIETDSEKSVEDQIQVPVPVEQSDNDVADGAEVKVTEKLQDTVTEEETEPSQNATQFKVQDDVREETVTLPPQKQSSTPPVGEPGADSEVAEVTSEEKQEEEGLTFNEWTQKVLAEAEKGKLEAKDDTQNVQLPPVKQRKKKNYASQECGAKILASNPEASSPKSVLNSNRDEYMNNPCKAKKWFVLELCEPIQAHSVDIASLELFSSQPKKFKLFLSDRYPTKDWKLAGEFTTKDERSIQTFTLTEAEDYFAKFVRVELTEHYGSEHFCPLTIFRMLGIAVVDYEIDHHDLNVDDDDDDSDNDENVGSDTEAGSKNLFTSAKDTVINIVKKVLNVESEEEQLIHNATQVNITSGVDNSAMNGTATLSDEDTLPCVPDVTSGGTEDESCVGKKDVDHSEKTLPLTPEPGKTDSVIVVKLEDDEQVETTPETAPGKSLHTHIHDCFLAMHNLANSKKKHSVIQSKFCELLYLIKSQRPVEQLSRNRSKKKSDDIREVKEEKNEIVKPLDEISSVKEKINTTVPLDVTHVEPVDSISTITDSGIESSATSSSDFVQSTELPESKLVSSIDSEKSKVSETAKLSPSTTSTFVQATSTEDITVLTGTQVLSSTQSVDHASEKQAGFQASSAFDQKVPPELETTEPSPTSVDTPREVTTETSWEATPVLPESWKPDTKDLMQDRTETQSQKTSDSIPAQTDTKQKPEPTSVTIQSEETKVVPASNGESIQPTEGADTGVSRTNDIRDELELLVRDTVEETPEQKANTTVIDEKVVVGSGGQQKRDDLNLVKLPAIPSGKRESAIMRLSNRIKVLEQNVSLSSRFLEELSRRYKKQSEDMMKMLNKTMATIHNMTIEADVKNKIHEDEMSAMERRLENLTQIVHQLTHSFDNLNRQVTDRQMIWTTIEIAIIIFMLLFLHLRPKKVTLPPEVRSLIESMPSKPTTSHPQRRNSLSGPATPSKEKTFGNLHSGASADLPDIHPTDLVSKQGTDGVKKKKKKKYKISGIGGPVHWENWSTQNSSQQPTTKMSQSKETSLKPLNTSNQSKKETSQLVNKNNQSKEMCLHTSCSMPQTQSSCFGSLLSGWSDTSVTKQRSVSLGTDVGAASNFAPVEETFHQSVQKDGLGTKTGTKGLSKKPLVQGGSKISPKLNLKNPKFSETGSINESSYRNEMKLDEKWVVKGHRRQKSLPKQHYSSVETVGSMNRDCASIGLQGNMKHSDTNPIPNKVQKRGEMKKSVSLPVSSESKFEKLPIYSKSFVNGHTECNGEIFDAEQTENCYSLDKSKSDVFCSTKYGGNVFNDETLINGSPCTNGADCHESVYSSVNQFNGYRDECDGIEYDKTSLEPLVVDNTNSIKNGKNGTWKNMFGYFR